MDARSRWLVVVWLCLACPVLAADRTRQENYAHYMDLCEKAKQAGDFAKMEIAIRHALQYGDGDEYVWRSLAWAQGRQGKWKESLVNARENIRRNGTCGWSLEQLAESELGNEDYARAARTLEQARQLPPDLLGDSEGPLKFCRDWLTSAVGVRTYTLRFTVDLKQGGPANDPIWLLLPQKQTRQQSFSFWAKNVISCRERHVGLRDYIEVVQKPGEPFYLESKLVLKPFCLGSDQLAKVPPGECPAELKRYLGKFQNWSWWNPDRPDVRAIAREVKSRTSAQTVQNVLEWFRKNIHFDGTIKDDPALGQLGTILKLRYGGCHHNSGLFVTICRAAGVPACVAHGVVLPMDDKEFTMAPNAGHGWAEVYINSIGWVPVEPMDVDSLRLFSARRAYMSVGASNRPPENHHFAGTINYGGREFRVVSIQHIDSIKGKLTKTELPRECLQNPMDNQR